ncbi:hypothetical protein GA0070623_0645 [Micromonospora rifamycinica]|uniref:Uncharacterized protein n=1 Tax=Micromonospora rifamycinica TaxID=291594 RepID=A0A1C5H2G1_9ACTN|nr:hypothetical protein GA0070623_0645 [Micromonospora rifamycinica]
MPADSLPSSNQVDSYQRNVLDVAKARSDPSMDRNAKLRHFTFFRASGRR